MKFTSIKPTLIGFTVFLTILFLGSCGVAEDTAPPNNPPPIDYMSFALTNSSGATVTTSTELLRGSTYGLVITPGSGASISTADYVVTHTPVAAITTNIVRTNSVDFTINNTADTTVTVTVAHRTDSSISETLTLTLAPQAPNMSFALTNLGGGALVNPTTQLSPGDGYRLLITRTTATTTPTEDYTITHTPPTAIIIETTLSNSVDFTVDATPATSVTFTITHRTNSAVSETLTLNFATAPSTPTSFQADIENATTVPNLILADALTREVLSPLSPLGSIRGGATLVKRYVTTNGGGSYDGSSWADAWAATNLRNGINTITDATANRVYLVMVAGATYKPTYTTSRGDSFSMKNYVAIMGGFDPAGGWGRTDTTIFSGDIGNAGDSTDNSYQVFSHTSITLNNAHLYGVTITNGNANGGTTAQRSGGGMHNSSSSPVLTKVIFSGNTATFSGGGMYNANSSSPVLTEVVFSGNTATSRGGGMYNNNLSSPVLTRVVFSGNTANSRGGGMFNNNGSSPVLTSVVFSGNTANSRGGGMFNNNGSSPVLTSVVFSGNTATGDEGGGMYNWSSSPVLTSVVFSGNTADDEGGGMYNRDSSPVMIGAVFTNNTAANGGAMYNDNAGQAGPLIVNTIFSANTLSGTGRGTNIAMDRGGFSTGTESIRIAGSVLGIGLAQPTNDIVGFNGGDALNIEYHSLANGAVRFGADATLTINGMSFTYPTITTGSSAINRGLFVRKHVNGTAITYYFSETEATTSWHTSFTSTGAGGLAGTAVILPTTGTIEDLTTTDIAGNARNGRPDAGVYELP